jgi:hypothetical protein
MRSQLVFDASAHIPNRYLLCRMLDVWNHAAHRPGSMGGSINEALHVVCSQKDAPTDLALRGPKKAVAAATLPHEVARVA